jgi:uncharacterized membrane protein
MTLLHTMETLELSLRSLAAVVRFLLETFSILCVIAGLVATLKQFVPFFSQRQRRQRQRPSNAVRLTFGSWLSMALEFQLGADIVATTTSPSGENLIQLGAVAVIRTFLNVFLAKEIELEQEQEEQCREAGGMP